MNQNRPVRSGLKYNKQVFDIMTYYYNLRIRLTGIDQGCFLGRVTRYQG